MKKKIYISSLLTGLLMLFPHLHGGALAKNENIENDEEIAKKGKDSPSYALIFGLTGSALVLGGVVLTGWAYKNGLGPFKEATKDIKIVSEDDSLANNTKLEEIALQKKEVINTGDINENKVFLVNPTMKIDKLSGSDDEKEKE